LLSGIFVKPGKPGFLPTHKPGFTGLKIGGFTRVFGCPGTRVAFPSAELEAGTEPRLVTSTGLRN